jgi:hypothetical protein
MISQATAASELDLLASFSLALRITGEEDRAVESVAAARRAHGSRELLIRAVRAEARARRGCAPASAPVARPASFAGVAHDDWQVLERVALRGMGASEAAASLELDRREVLLRLQRGLRAARECLAAGKRQLGDDARAVGRHGLCDDRAAGIRDDPLRDRQPEAAAGPLVSC